MPAVNGVSTQQELKQFNDHLATRAYLHGFLPSQEDQYVFSSVSSAPAADKHPHVARWYKHIQSFTEAERAAWPKRSQDGAAVAGGGTAKAPANAVKQESATPAKEDDFDLFGSEDEEESEEKKKKTEELLKAYAEKKKKKPGPIAKSNVIYDIKPWDDTIDIKEIEQKVRSIEMDGLVWGSAKVLPVAFGINKLQIACCVEDEKVSTDVLEEQITSFEDLVQSVDVVAFNKV